MPRPLGNYAGFALPGPISLANYHGCTLPGPQSLVNYAGFALPVPRSLVNYAGFALPGRRSLVNYAASTLPGPRSLVNYEITLLGASPGPSSRKSCKTKRISRDILEIHARGTRHARDILGIPARGTLFRVAVGAPDPVIYEGFCEKRVYHLFYERKRGSADLVIYRGSEMGGPLSSSGHAKNALVQLRIHTFPRKYRRIIPPARFPSGPGVNH